MELSEYMERLTGQIRSKKARPFVEQEIRDHIDDQASAYEAQGMEREQAVREAVRQMGDPVEVGIEMDRIHRPKTEWRLIVLVLFLSVLGLLIQYFSLYRLGAEISIHQPIVENAFARQCVYTILGLLVMGIVYYLDYSLIGKYGRLIYVLLLAALFILSATAPVINGSHSNMKTLLYLFVPVFGGILNHYRNQGYWGILCSLMWLAAAFWMGIYRIGGGLGVTFDMAIVCYVMLFLAAKTGWFQTAKRSSLILLGAVLPIGLLILVLLTMKPYQMIRLTALLNPEQYAMTQGYQLVTARKLVQRLPILGAGDIKSMDLEQLPLVFLPEVSHDYIVLQYASVYGILAAGLLICILACFLAYLFRLARKQKNELGRLISYGCALVFTIETARNLLNNFGLYTLSTGGLPFLSYGKCHTLAVYALLGVMLSIYRYKDLVWNTKKKTRTGRPEMTAQLGSYRIRIERCK